VINCYDGANRVSQVGGPTCGNPTLTTYAASFAYAAHGAPTQYAMGNNVWHEPSYNSRLQMSEFVDLVNNSYGDELLGAGLTWYKSSNSSLNNGNLWGATYNNGGPGYPSFLSFTQSFAYDGVNRLTTASDSGGWTRTFGYDAFGNMTPSGNPNPPTESFNSNNQITGLSYDQAGNQISVNGNTVAYDFENHVTSETDGVTQAVESYVYDGDGRRVMKSGPAGTSVFVYDAMGQLAGEYGSVASMPPCLTCYLTPDHLGTPRLITDQSGNVVARHDYLPFGEEVAANTFGRNSQFGAGNDSVRQKFTGQQRDSESGLDYFEARYYGSALGRFTSPDDGSDNDPADPQSWNLYAYVWNNPMANTDPDGHGCQTTTFTQTDSNGNVIARDYLADFSDCSRRLILGTASLMIQSMIPSIRSGQNALDWASRARNETCLAASTAAGASVGAGYGLFGLAGGPAVGITEPTAMGIGGLAGWAGGMVSCMSSNGGTGGNGGNTQHGAERIQERAMSDDEIAEAKTGTKY
jgi:RHS repeat-associated protein